MLQLSEFSNYFSSLSVMVALQSVLINRSVSDKAIIQIAKWLNEK